MQIYINDPQKIIISLSVMFKIVTLCVLPDAFGNVNDNFLHILYHVTGTKKNGVGFYQLRTLDSALSLLFE